MRKRMFSRGRALRALKLGGGISRIVAKVLHKTSWMGRVETGRHRKAVLQLMSNSGIDEEAMQKAYVDRMLQLDENMKQTGSYGSFDTPKVYSDALNYQKEFGVSSFAPKEAFTSQNMQRSLDDFF